MSDFDPATPLVMDRFKTVLGHNLTRGTALVIVDEPRAAGEVDATMAERLFAAGIAVAAHDRRPTPVESPDGAAGRDLNVGQGEGAESLESSPSGTPADLLAWETDDQDAGAKAGDRVTNAHLALIAAREGVEVEPGDNKAELIRKIVAARTASAAP